MTLTADKPGPVNQPKQRMILGSVKRSFNKFWSLNVILFRDDFSNLWTSQTS